MTTFCNKVLQRCGFLGPDGQPRPLSELDATFRDKDRTPDSAAAVTLEAPAQTAIGAAPCPQCGGHFAIIDGGLPRLQ